MKRVMRLDDGTIVSNDSISEPPGAFRGFVRGNKAFEAFWIYMGEFTGIIKVLPNFGPAKTPYEPVYSVIRQDGSTNDTCWYSPQLNTVIVLEGVTFDNRRESDGVNRLDPYIADTPNFTYEPSNVTVNVIQTTNVDNGASQTQGEEPSVREKVMALAKRKDVQAGVLIAAIAAIWYFDIPVMDIVSLLTAL